MIINCKLLVGRISLGASTKRAPEPYPVKGLNLGIYKESNIRW